MDVDKVSSLFPASPRLSLTEVWEHTKAFAASEGSRLSSPWHLWDVVEYLHIYCFILCLLKWVPCVTIHT